jgi:hypothetical protein
MNIQATQNDKSKKRIERMKTKDDVLETGVYFNGPLLRYEAWLVSGDTKELVGWMDIEPCVTDPKLKDYWDKYVWEEHIVICKLHPKDLLEKVLGEDPAQDLEFERMRHNLKKVA